MGAGDVSAAAAAADHQVKGTRGLLRGGQRGPGRGGCGQAESSAVPSGALVVMPGGWRKGWR